MGPAKHSKTHGLMGMCTDLAPQEAQCWVFGSVRNQTELFFLSKPGLLAGYPDQVLTLLKDRFDNMFFKLGRTQILRKFTASQPGKDHKINTYIICLLD